MADGTPTDEELDALVSHLLALRLDFVQGLLRSNRIRYSGLRKAELRDRVREALDDGRLTPEAVVRFLDDAEPGGKQHVFIVRPPRRLNDDWRDAGATRDRLSRRRTLRPLLEAALPVLMPDELTLSAIRLGDGLVEIVGVEARRYYERDETYDRATVSEEGLPVELRGFVQHIARTIVALRWNTATRHAALHITQASGRGLERNHYRNVLARFGATVGDWLDMSEFDDVDLHKVIHALHERERTNTNVLTRSRRARWETVGGSEMEAISASVAASVFNDTKMTAAIGQVADADTGQSGNLFWLPVTGSPLTEELHVTIVAFDSRVHFMRPSTPTAVDHVIGQIRSLL
jgi:hypothetical protein